MIFRMQARWRRFRKAFSRVEWMVRLLGLPKEPPGEAGATTTHGLVMVQIDGLSHIELQRALREGEMPFLSRLLERENYAVRKMYSGLPSNTPAMQAELFYGVPGAVPAFGFFHKGCGRMCRMLEPESAREIEAGLAQKGEPLLRDGSAYSDIYTGGAREPRWCAASMGWGTSTKSPGPFLMALLALLNLYGLLRAVAFGVLEIGLATFDAIRGVFGGSKPKHEFKFIPARVGVCVLLREWITHAARMDISRGLPVIHLNLLGYDEQSHHRGPDSAFAHWVLGGIDDSIKRVWRAAKNSDRRPYEVWIYSDHGQVRSTPYLEATGRTLKETVCALWGECRDANETKTEGDAGIPPGPKGSAKGSVLWKGAHGTMKVPPPAPVRYPLVSDFGPLALVYLEPDATGEQRARLGERLAREAHVPVVVDARAFESSGGPLGGWTAQGPFSFPADADAILAGHPFREALMADLERVARHEHGGDLILLGWKSGIGRPLTFAFEYGAHGGISPEECTAFVAMPDDLERETLAPGFMRPLDLRRAALLHLGREDAGDPPAPPSRPAARLRVMTYNVHSCIGLDQRHDVRRIARVIAHYHPDVVCLQELDVGHARTGGLHQARQIAALLRFEYHFHSVREVQDQKFGNAILSRYPLEIVKVGGLPGPKPGPRQKVAEARGALWVEVEAAGRRVQILNTHLGLGAEERYLQVKALLGPEWLGGREAGVPLIVCGDLNCGPGSPPYRLLCGELSDCQLQPPRHKARPTWFSSWPLLRLDHIFVADPLVARHIHIPTFHLAKAASDHLPVIADIAFPETENAETAESSAPSTSGGDHV
jgi:endonuclease/exonuclease/phosphatase family metal-dependent hydrolase